MGLVVAIEVYSLAGNSTEGSMFVRWVNALSVVRVIRLGTYIRTIPELVYVIVKSLEVIFPLLLLQILANFFWSILGRTQRIIWEKTEPSGKGKKLICGICNKHFSPDRNLGPDNGWHQMYMCACCVLT